MCVRTTGETTTGSVDDRYLVFSRVFVHEMVAKHLLAASTPLRVPSSCVLLCCRCVVFVCCVHEQLYPLRSTFPHTDLQGVRCNIRTDQG